MFAEQLNTRLLTALQRPDLRIVAGNRPIAFDATLDTPFRACPDGALVLGAACLGEERLCAFHLRHALELAALLDAAPLSTAVSDLPDSALGGLGLRILAALCAARTAARFWLLDAAPRDLAPLAEPAAWLGPMAAAVPPDLPTLRQVWIRVRALQGDERVGRPDDVDARTEDWTVIAARLAAGWMLLGPAETLMAGGGDARLAVDPATGLNHYGCSHRPRPWAITFASSTASSLSERGFGGAESARLRLIAGCLAGAAPAALTRETETVRRAIAAHYGLEAPCRVVLAASGTDLEMAALALCCLDDADGRPALPVSNVLLAPEETGTGVPLAAGGRHFAGDTARGRTVVKGELIAGFPDSTRVLSVAIRDPAGRMLPDAAVDAACRALVRAEAAEGRRVLLHRLDVSKTGLLAPGMDCIETLRTEIGPELMLVVDACQARLDAGRIREALRHGWMVMVTGSKFFTGPPFCGALLLPPGIAARLHGPGRLPVGLGDYGGAADWPLDALAAPDAPGANPGMVLRWQAALAEMAAFAAVPAPTARLLVRQFTDGVEAALAACPDVLSVPVPPPQRRDLDDGPAWDQEQTIRSFLVLEPPHDQDRLPLDMERARQVYRWLNADITRALPPTANDRDRALAKLLIHVGQPAPVADDRLHGMAGALRISVGARLLSGEPSHAGLGDERRMRREIADVGRILSKIGVILRCWAALVEHDPVPRYAPDPAARRRTDPGLNI